MFWIRRPAVWSSFSDAPDALDGVDPEKLSTATRALNIALKPLRLASQAKKNQLDFGSLIRSLPGPSKSFQTLPAMRKQWSLSGTKSSKPAVSMKRILYRPGGAWSPPGWKGSRPSIRSSLSNCTTGHQEQTWFWGMPKTTSGNQQVPSMPKVSILWPTCRLKKSLQRPIFVWQMAMWPPPSPSATMGTWSKALRWPLKMARLQMFQLKRATKDGRSWSLTTVVPVAWVRLS